MMVYKYLIKILGMRYGTECPDNYWNRSIESHIMLNRVLHSKIHKQTLFGVLPNVIGVMV